ncbi:ashwin [Oncorhynchus keta]|uniref:ashwin n=1 Tax=Oncorhynchus keta TaxID=8018 RepID=UPI0015FCE2A9|nr:ashwin [Oncorhynchus keta]
MKYVTTSRRGCWGERAKMARSTNMGREGKDTSQDRGASNADLLLHPELLSHEFIQLVLNEKKITSGDDGSRDQLTALYLRHVIPLPQRELPNNRWGKKMEQTRARQSTASGQSRSFSDDHNRKRPLIVFDGSSSKSVPVRLKKPEGQTSGSGVTDRFKHPPSMNLFSPIRKLSSTTPTPSSSHSPGGPHRSPTGNKGLGSPPSSPKSVNLKRDADSSGELKEKKKIQKVTWP